jgi:hypothetical protein
MRLKNIYKEYPPGRLSLKLCLTYKRLNIIIKIKIQLSAQISDCELPKADNYRSELNYQQQQETNKIWKLGLQKFTMKGRYQ